MPLVFSLLSYFSFIQVIYKCDAHNHLHFYLKLENYCLKIYLYPKTYLKVLHDESFCCCFDQCSTHFEYQEFHQIKNPCYCITRNQQDISNANYDCACFTEPCFLYLIQFCDMEYVNRLFVLKYFQFYVFLLLHLFCD